LLDVLWRRSANLIRHGMPGPVQGRAVFYHTLLWDCAQPG
jgi:hypothetical protein